MSAVGPALPSLAEQTNSSLGSIGFLFTARSFGYMIGSLVAGRLFDRYAGHPVVVVSLVCITISFALIPISTALILLILLVIFMGLSEAGIDVGVNSMLIWIHGAAVPPFMNGLHFFFGLGAFFSPIIFAQFVSAGWQSTAMFWVLAVMVVPVSLVIARLPSPTFNVRTTESQSNSITNGLTLLIALGFFLYVGIEVGLSGWIYTYALSSNLADEISAAYLTSAFWAAFTVGRFISIPLARWFRPVILLAVDLVGMIAGFCVLIFISGSPALWVGTGFTGVAMASFFPSFMSFVGSKIQVSARITGRLFLGSSLGGMLVPWLIGQYFESNGPQYTMVILGVLAVFLSILFGAILTVTRPREKTVAVDT